MRSSSLASPIAFKSDKGVRTVVSETAIFENRSDMYKNGNLPVRDTVLELGVYLGDNALDLYDALDPELLVLADPWEETTDPRFKASNHDVVQEKVKGKRTQIIKGTEDDVLERFRPGFFSMVYIDTTHTYADTKRQLHKLHGLVKRNGYLCGHDFGHPEDANYGVVGAVFDFMITNGWSLSHVTTDDEPYRSFCITKVSI